MNDLVNHINTEIDEINSNTDIVHKRIEKMINKLKSKDNEIVELKNKIKLLETENTRGNKALEKAHKLELNSLRQNLNQQINAYEDRMNEISVAINSREIEWSKKVSKLEESMERLRESEIKSENIKKDGQEALRTQIVSFENTFNELKKSHKINLNEINAKFNSKLKKQNKIIRKIE